MFASSVIQEKSSDLPVNGLITGMTEGLQLMSVGDQYQFWLPSELAYGENPIRSTKRHTDVLRGNDCHQAR
jgi:FKBP-type peptidyl-prolyl cis-trans isomerase